MHRAMVVAGCALLLATAGYAPSAVAENDAQMIAPKDIKWGPAPPALPKGVKVAVLKGDPAKPGPFVIRIKTSGPFRIPPHWHSQDEDLTVISGVFYLGLGDRIDAKSTHALPAGGFHSLPAKAHHYALAKGPTVIQVSGNGPFDITYVNPADDPQKKT
ncbi:MAG TPA: cupin domain-containing protein [Casimicrobiaceae bacterium]|nr:cupin domain-containing protein [Casimicrobiaceae bacterium]